MSNEHALSQPLSAASAQTEEGLIEKPEIARRLDKSPRTVDAWMRKGYLPYIKIGKTVLFRWSAVLSHLEARFRVNG